MISPDLTVSTLSPSRLPCVLQRRLDQAFTDAEQFEYAIAHDLRSPIRNVAASASILLEEIGSALGKEHHDLLKDQIRSANRFGRLIDDLLELSRLNRTPPRRSLIDLTGIIGRIDPLVEVEPGLTLCGDPELVERALDCLIDNARKFSRDAPIYVLKKGQAVTIVDEGVGFDPIYASRIFRPLVRLVGESVPGTGIGLALVQSIARLHGGGVEVLASPGLGAAFTIDFGQ